MNYFSLLSIPESFDIDLAALETAYFREQRRYHPDKFVNKPPAERQAAMQRSVDINHAYHVLKNPLTRAQYLLSLHGITMGKEQDSIKPSQELLVETLEWREEIEHASPHKDKLAEIEKLLREKHMTSLHVISREYGNKLWEAMAQETLRLGYIEKSLESCRQGKAA